MDIRRYVPTEYPAMPQTTGKILGRCKYFEALLVECGEAERVPLHGDRFSALVCIDGDGTLAIGNMQLAVRAGECVFLPASEEIMTVTGRLSMILCYI